MHEREATRHSRLYETDQCLRACVSESGGGGERARGPSEGYSINVGRLDNVLTLCQDIISQYESSSSHMRCDAGVEPINALSLNPKP